MEVEAGADQSFEPQETLAKLREEQQAVREQLDAMVGINTESILNQSRVLQEVEVWKAKVEILEKTQTELLATIDRLNGVEAELRAYMEQQHNPFLVTNTIEAPQQPQQMLEYRKPETAKRRASEANNDVDVQEPLLSQRLPASGAQRTENAFTNSAVPSDRPGKTQARDIVWEFPAKTKRQRKW